MTEAQDASSNGSESDQSTGSAPIQAETAVAIPDPGPMAPDTPIPPPSASSRLVPPPYAHQVPVQVREPRIPTPLLPSWLAAGCLAAIGADLALRRAPWNNIATSILIVALAAGLLASGFVLTKTSKALVVVAVFFGLFLAVQTEPLLTTINVFVACSLLIVGAVHGQGRNLWDLRPFRVLADVGAVLMESAIGIAEVPAEVSARLRVAKEKSEVDGDGTSWAVLRGLLIAVPVVLVLGLLLASADAVFQSFFSGFGSLNAGSIIGHIVLLAIGAYAMMVLLRLASIQGGDQPSQLAPSLGHIEALIMLVGVNVLFTAFAVAQLMTVLGGADDALERAGLDSKHFARQGFFQLLWVAGITLAVLMTLHVTTASNKKARKPVRFLSLVTVALTLLIVVVAFTRISFYVDDGGQTPLRLYSGVFSIWVGLCFVVVAVRIWGVRPAQAWLLPVLAVTGLAVLGVLNVAGPERIIALDNLNRDHDALVWHMRANQFTSEGNAVLATEIDRLSPERRVLVAEELCSEHAETTYKNGWLNYNRSQRQAEEALEALCS